MNAGHYDHCLRQARELSIRYACIIVLLVPPNGVWSFRTYTSAAQARLLFNRKVVGHRGFPRETPMFIARNGVIMAQRRMEECEGTASVTIAVETAEGDE